MKKVIIPAMILIIYIAGANAMNKGLITNRIAEYNHSPGVEVKINNMGDSLYTLNQLESNLELTQQQIPVVDSILTDAANKLNAVTDSGQLGMQQKQQIIEDANSAIENILTDEQRAKFDAMKSQSGSSGY